jgi:copper chaperone CopZ
MNKIFSIFILLCASIAQAQLQWTTVGIDGLTCSQCLYSVEQSIRRLPTVEEVSMNFNTHEATVKQKIVGYSEILKVGEQVIKAGFSVRFLTMTITMDTAYNIANSKITNSLGSLVFLGNTKLDRDSTYTFQIIDKRFCKKNIYKPWHSHIKTYKAKNEVTNNNIFVIQATTAKPQ